MSHLIHYPKIVDLAKLKPLAHRSKGKITKLYLHWTAGRYEQVFDDYHISIGKTGTIYLSCNDFTELKTSAQYDLHYALEQEAKANKRGLWAQDKPIAPWIWRANNHILK